MDAIEKKCHGSHSKDRKDKYNDKYIRKTKKKRETKTRMSGNEETRQSKLCGF